MKKLITSFAALAILVSLAAQSWAASYELGTTAHIETMDEGSGGDWTDWIHCDDVIGSDAAPRGLHTYFMTEQGNAEKIRLACRAIQSDGSFSSSYTFSDYFFNTTDDGSYDNTQTSSNSKFPVGVEYSYSCDGVRGFTFLEYSASKIASGSNNDDASSTSTSAGVSGSVGGCFIGISVSHPLVCPDGSLITGMKLKIEDANWPYTGKMVHGFKIKCTELETY
jgi:hypothetical protein